MQNIKNSAISKINHIAIAINNLEEAAKFYQNVLGLNLSGVEVVTAQKTRVGFFKIGESNIESNAAAIVQIELNPEDRTIVRGEDGVITIPVGASSLAITNTPKLRFMRTINNDGVQVHYSLGGGRPELLKYNIEAPAAGKYELTAKVCTVTLDREFMLRLNRRTLIDIPLPYTKGYWGDTQPTEVALKEGRNSFQDIPGCRIA